MYGISASSANASADPSVCGMYSRSACTNRARKSTSSSFCDVCSMRDGIGTSCSARPPRASISRGCDSDLAIHFVPSRFVTLAALNSSTTSARS